MDIVDIPLLYPTNIGSGGIYLNETPTIFLRVWDSYSDMAPPLTSTKPSEIHSNFFFWLLNVGVGGAILLTFWFYGVLIAMCILILGMVLNIVLFLDHLRESWLKTRTWLLDDRRTDNQS